MNFLLRTDQPIPQRRRLLPVWVVFLGLIPASQVAAEDKPPEDPVSSMAALKLFTRTVERQNQQDWDNAITEWRTFLRQFPDDAMARQAQNYLGVCLLQQKKYDDAAAEFSRVILAEKNDAIAEEALLNLGLCYYTKGFADDRKSLVKAAKLFDAQAKTYLDGAFRDQALFFLAESLSMLEEHEKAATYYQQLIAEYPKSSLRADALRALAVGQMGQGQTDNAQKTFSKLVDQYPEDEAAQDVTLHNAETLLASGQYKEAAAAFAEIADSEQEGADYALLRCGLCHEHAEEFLRAASIYEQLEQRFPGSEFLADAWLGAGRAYGLAQDTVKAERCLQKIQTDNADTALEVAHWRCRIQLYGGHAPEAARIAKAALAQHPDAAWRTEVLLDEAEAISLIPQKQTLAAAKYLQLADELPDGELHWRATLGAADCLLQIKRYADAERIAEAFLSAHANNEHRPAFQFIAAESARLQGNHDAAQQQLQQLIQQFPQHPMVTTWRIRLANSLAQCGRYEQTLEVLQRVTDQNASATQFAEATYLRGASLRKLERMNEAAMAFREARAADPQGAWAATSQESLDEIAAYVDQFTTSAPPEQVARDAQQELPEPQNETSKDRLLEELTDASDARRIPPREVELHAAALLAVDSGDVISAVQGVSELLTEFPQSRLAADALLYIGESTYSNGDYARAEKIFRKAVELEGDAQTSESALYKLAWAQLRLAKDQDALQSFTRLTESYPQGKFLADSRFMQADCYFRLEQFEQALSIFKQLRNELDLSPHVRSRVLFLGARCLQKTGAWSESIVWLKELMKSDPQTSMRRRGAFMLGLAYEQTHDDELALQNYRAATLDGRLRTRLQAQLQIARVLCRQDKLTEAVPLFEQVIADAQSRGGQPELQRLASLSALEAAQCAQQLAQTCHDSQQAAHWKSRGQEFLEMAADDAASDDIRQAASQLKGRF